MRRDHRSWSAILYLGMVVFLIQGMAAKLAIGQSQTPPNVFFSQGQAVYNPQEPAKSQREALQDFQLQAIAQAASVLLSPPRMENQFHLIQEKILRQPQRYIQSFQVFSEAPAAGGLYRVAGQVTISMDLLKKDLMALPPAVPEAKPATQSEPGRPAEGPALRGPRGMLEPAGKPMSSGQQIFWAVAEKWEENWHLPGDRRDSDAPFAASSVQELEIYGWTVHFAQAGTLTADEDGDVDAGEALAQASALGLRHVVLGTVAVTDEKVEGEARVAASLRLLNATSGKGQGEIHREKAIGDETSYEVAIELASFVAPQLDRQLRSLAEPAAPGAGEVTAASEAVAGVEERFRPEEAGELLVQIQSADAYSEWLAIEAKVREQAPNLQVKGLEIGPQGSRVRLLGVDAASLKKLDGSRLPNGSQVQVTTPGTEGQLLRITLTKPAPSPGEPKP